jgi:hypothetical protein
LDFAEKVSLENERLLGVRWLGTALVDVGETWHRAEQSCDKSQHSKEVLDLSGYLE